MLLLLSHSNHVNGTGGNANLMELFVLPGNERWYATRAGQVLFVNIDSTYRANADVMTDELPWIDAQVVAAHDGIDESDVRGRIVHLITNIGTCRRRFRGGGQSPGVYGD